MPKVIKFSSNSYQHLLGVLLFILFTPSLSLAQTGLPPQDHAQSEGSIKKHKIHWDYLGVEGPKHWGLLSKEYVSCETGSKQSPVNIQTQGLSHHQEELKFNYNISELHEIYNGHTIQVSHESGGNIALNKHTYKLRQFHFHEPSEHHIDGKTFPMEMHLVHQDETGHILVIAVMMDIGPEHKVLKKLLSWLPNQIGSETSIPMEGSLREILPKNTHHYTYNGSLTTPPCTEGVKWLVFTEPINISEESVKTFLAVIGNNARPIQPLGNRHIELN
jgi:carbonic anhydrase